MEPVTRKEHFLARIAGKPHDESLFPITREEFFLNDIATNGGGGGGGGSFVETAETFLLSETTLTFASVQIDEETELIAAEFTPELTLEELETLAQSPGLSALQLVVDGTTHTGFQPSEDGIANESFTFVPIGLGSDENARTLIANDPNFTPGAHVVSFAFVATVPTAAFAEAYQLASGGGGPLDIVFHCDVIGGTDDPEIPFSALRAAYLAGRAIRAVNIIHDCYGDPHEMPLEIARVVPQDIYEEGMLVEPASFTFKGVTTVMRSSSDGQYSAYTVDLRYNSANFAEVTAAYQMDAFECSYA